MSKNHARLEIGGYFGLELGRGQNYPHLDALHLNSARNAFHYALKMLRPSRVFIPSYICKSMTEPLVTVGIPYDYYNISEDLEVPENLELKPSEIILYVNYFGIKNSYSSGLANRFPKALIIDNSQALFASPCADVPCIYSPRKFVGVADGGLLHSNFAVEDSLECDSSLNASRHLIGRLDASAADLYHEYRRSEDSLVERPLMAMSKFTRSVLQSFDYDRIKLIRERNFWYLHAYLSSINRMQIVPSEVCGPMVYPFLTKIHGIREKLISNHIYVAKYWPGITSNPRCTAWDQCLMNELIPLPIDQRYTTEDMELIIEVLLDG